MTNDEILQAAKDAGFAPNRSYTNIPVTGYATHDLSDQIKAFASIIEKRTIKRCAEECDYVSKNARPSTVSYAYKTGADECAAAIRKLGKQE